jgi:hypothetical protein
MDRREQLDLLFAKRAERTERIYDMGHRDLLSFGLST